MMTRVLAVVAVAAASLFAQQDGKPTAPAQPLPFSHKTHSATGLKCQECHPNPDPGERMTLPAVAKCMACHITIAKDQPAIHKLAEFARSKQPIPWVRVYSVAAGVYWSHRSHLDAGMTCDACHGQVAQMDETTKVSNATTMAGCIACHRKNQANTGCEFCHEGK
jgi:class III cytochrome C family protein/cytochrome c7-like protein